MKGAPAEKNAGLFQAPRASQVQLTRPLAIDVISVPFVLLSADTQFIGFVVVSREDLLFFLPTTRAVLQYLVDNMVIFGGLEFVAAGIVLHELGKDEDKARQTAENRRRRRHRSHSHHRRDSDSRPRPPRPSQQALAPPVMPPPRPGSAPPQQHFPPQGHYPPPNPGPWQNGPPPPQQQRPPPFPQQGQPAHTQSWPTQPHPPPNPHIPRPNTQPPPQLGPNSPMFRPSDFPTNPASRPPFPQNQSAPPPAVQHPQYSQSPPPPPQYNQQPAPGQFPHKPPTMHYDTKTGKWQSGMLPREDAQRSGSAPPDPSGGNRTGRSRTMSNNNNMAAPPSRLREGQRAYSSGSYSDDDDESSSGSETDDLAYGSLPGRRRRRRRRSSGRGAGMGGEVGKVYSYERQRPGQQGPVELRAEEDWYARGREERVGRYPGNNGVGVGGRGRSGTMPVELDSRPRYELA